MCWSWFKPACMSQLLNIQEFCKLIVKLLVASNWPWWEYLQHKNWHMLQIKASLPASIPPHPTPWTPSCRNSFPPQYWEKTFQGPNKDLYSNIYIYIYISVKWLRIRVLKSEWSGFNYTVTYWVCDVNQVNFYVCISTSLKQMVLSICLST